MLIHFVITGFIVLAAGLAAVAYYAFRKHESVKAALLQFKAAADSDAASLLNKVHALENGGHLAAGTTQQLVNAQISAVVPNGGQPPAALTPVQS